VWLEKEKRNSEFGVLEAQRGLSFREEVVGSAFQWAAWSSWGRKLNGWNSE